MRLYKTEKYLPSFGLRCVIVSFWIAGLSTVGYAFMIVGLGLPFWPLLAFGAGTLGIEIVGLKLESHEVTVWEKDRSHASKGSQEQ